MKNKYQYSLNNIKEFSEVLYDENGDEIGFQNVYDSGMFKEEIDTLQELIDNYSKLEKELKKYKPLSFHCDLSEVSHE